MTNSGSNEFVELDPERDQSRLYKTMFGCIVPRPIAFVTTVSVDGICNAAPFSLFNGISDIPPMVYVSICKDALTGNRKDTLANILDTGEFVVNIVSEDIAEAQDKCAKPFPPEVDEMSVTGLTALPSKLIRPPRIKESPANFECQLFQSIPLQDSSYTLILGRVVSIHVRKDVFAENGRIDPLKLRAVARMGGFSYARTRDLFAIEHNIPDMAARGAGLAVG